MSQKHKYGSKVLVSNKNVKRNYSIEKTYEAGIILEGWEVKSIRNGAASIESSFVKSFNEGLYIVNFSISAWKHGFDKSKYIEQKPRKLLLHKAQIRRIVAFIKQSGCSVIPTKLYTSGHLIKVEIAIGKALKKYDKRKRIKEKEQKRRINQERVYYNM